MLTSCVWQGACRSESSAGKEDKQMAHLGTLLLPKPPSTTTTNPRPHKAQPAGRAWVPIPLPGLPNHNHNSP